MKTRLGLSRLGRLDQVVIENLEDVLADWKRCDKLVSSATRDHFTRFSVLTASELSLDLLTVSLDGSDLSGVSLGL